MPMPTVNDYLQRAVAALAARDMNRAEKLTRDLLAKDATNVEAWNLLAYIYQEAGQPEQAIEHCEAAVRLNPWHAAFVAFALGLFLFLAVFGIPLAHEDDALRAVRAVAQIRERLTALGEELAVPLSFRTGVNTGDAWARELLDSLSA